MGGFHVLNYPLIILTLVILLIRWHRPSKLKQPPRLNETVPFISNAWQFMTNKRFFIERVRDALKTSPIVQCRLGPMNIYLVTGDRTISAIFRSSFSSDPWVLRVLEHSGGYAPVDLAKFAADQTGGAHVSRKGSSGLPAPEKRIWHAKHRLHDETLVNAASVRALSTEFQNCFGQRLAHFPVGEWVEDVRVSSFMKQNIAFAATRSFLGSRIFEVNPGFVDAFWEYERHVEPLAFGLPHWLNRRAVRARDLFQAMCLKWYQTADSEFDWGNNQLRSDVDWEPVFGSQISRGLARWVKSFDFSAESIGGLYALFVFGLHSNTIAISTWAIMEIIRDPDLFHEVKEELSQAGVTDRSTGDSLDIQRLVSLPLLQSIYTETLRVHVSILITRTSVEPVMVDGYELPAGSTFQAPTHVAHFDEATWGTAHHPASEFWAYRHIKEVEIQDSTGNVATQREFSIMGKAGSFFPYGGGINICAGRNFAKHEVLLVLAMMASKFDMEFIEWIKPDGAKSDRPAMDDSAYGNGIAAPPDRDMKVRWRRRV